MNGKPNSIPFTRRLPAPPQSLQWQNQKRENTYTIPVEREQRLIGWLFRLGFKVDQQCGDLGWHWVRFYNVRRADHSKDWEGNVKPRSYNRGALGVQINWGNFSDFIHVHVWRNDANPPANANA